MIIATHSPILLALPGAVIYSFDEGKVKPISYEETQAYEITHLFLTRREQMLAQLLGKNHLE